MDLEGLKGYGSLRERAKRLKAGLRVTARELEGLQGNLRKGLQKAV